MDLITTTLPIFESGYVIGELTVHVRPAFDQAFSNPFMASDVVFEDSQGDRHGFNDSSKREVLAAIRRDQPLVWAEIEAAAHPSLAA